jgi:hypothetical protein
MASGRDGSSDKDTMETESPSTKGLLQNRLNFPSFTELPDSSGRDERYFALDFKYGSWKPCRTWCFLAEIDTILTSSDQSSLFDGRIIVHDRDGKNKIPITFRPTQRQFDWSTLKKSSTLLILYPQKHKHIDGRVGLLVVRFEHVRVLDCSLNDLLSLSVQYEKCRDKNECWCCGKTGISADAVKRCSRCRVAKYCDKQCQTKDWKQRHRASCPVIPDYLKLTKLKYDVWRENQTFDRIYI